MNKAYDDDDDAVVESIKSAQANKDMYLVPLFR